LLGRPRAASRQYCDARCLVIRLPAAVRLWECSAEAWTGPAAVTLLSASRWQQGCGRLRAKSFFSPEHCRFQGSATRSKPRPGTRMCRCPTPSTCSERGMKQCPLCAQKRTLRCALACRVSRVPRVPLAGPREDDGKCAPYLSHPPPGGDIQMLELGVSPRLRQKAVHNAIERVGALVSD